MSYESAIYSSANAGTGKTLTIWSCCKFSYKTDGSDQILNHILQIMSYYRWRSFNYTRCFRSGIAKAPLTVRRNDSLNLPGKMIRLVIMVYLTKGLPDESSSVLSGHLHTTAVRHRKQGNGNTYDLTPSGLISANYNFNYQNGTFTIVPENQLVLQLPIRIVRTEIQAPTL